MSASNAPALVCSKSAPPTPWRVILFPTLEVQFQAELDVAGWSGGRNLAEGRIRRPEAGISIRVPRRTRSETQVRRSEVCPVEGIEHVRLETEVESLLETKLLTYREVPGLQIWALDNSHGGIAAKAYSGWGKCRWVDPAIRTYIGKQHRTTNVVCSAGTDGCTGCRRKIGAALETRYAANFPARKQHAADTFHVAEEWNVIVVGSHEDVTPIKRCRAKVVVTIEWILAHV